MPVVSFETLAHAGHQLGVLIWVGSLFFVRLILLPATTGIRAPMDRMRVRVAVYQRMFRWGWLGLLLIWASGLWGLKALDPSNLPSHVVGMMGMAALMVVFQLIGYVAFLLNMEVAVDEKRLIRAAKNNFWMRKLILVNLFLGLAAAVLGASGGYLFG